MLFHICFYQDVLYGDIDYMDRYMDFTVDETNYGTQNLSNFVDDLHARGQRYIIILVSSKRFIQPELVPNTTIADNCDHNV